MRKAAGSKELSRLLPSGEFSWYNLNKCLFNKQKFGERLMANEKEKQILALIKKNPFISQNEIARELKLSRSAVANYISSLMRKGEIVGRAYILPRERKITCIGGANIDQKMYLSGNIKWRTSNPVRTEKSLGGVARNIAENLGRLGAAVSLVTALGNDEAGKWLQESTGAWADLSPVMNISGANTGHYTAIIDGSGEMIVALADMGIYDRVAAGQLAERWNHIGSSSFVLLDTNFPKDVIQYVITRCGEEKIPLAVATVSVPKAEKLPEDLSGIKLLIVNRDEAEAVAKTEFSEKNPLPLADALFRRGLEKLVVTAGEKGVFYFDRSGFCGHLPAPEAEVRDVTGAGDALAAGVIYGLNEGKHLAAACQIGLACSYLTVQSEKTVAEELNGELLAETVRNLWNDTESNMEGDF